MRTIDSDIKSNNFKHVYLLFGTEGFLVRGYRKSLLDALKPDDSNMNVTWLKDSECTEAAIIDAADTMPFFAEHRVVIVQESGFFSKKSQQLADYIKDIPETAYLVFCESKVDKRTGTYKAVQKYGDAEELNLPDERTLRGWITRRAKAENLVMTDNAWRLFYARTGESMDQMSNEMDKLISYCYGKDTIEEEDVAACCFAIAEDRIFDMLESIAKKDPVQVIKLYRDLLLRKEEPLKIIAILRSQFIKILTVKEMTDRHERSDAISRATGIRPYFLKKTQMLADNFKREELCSLLKDTGDTEAKIKTGLIDPRIGLEVIMMKYSTISQ